MNRNHLTPSLRDGGDEDSPLLSLSSPFPSFIPTPTSTPPSPWASSTNARPKGNPRGFLPSFDMEASYLSNIREDPAESLSALHLSEASSLGILSAETLAGGNMTASDTFKFANLTALSKPTPGEVDESEAIFKVPVAPPPNKKSVPAAKEIEKNALPLSMIAPTNKKQPPTKRSDMLGDTFMSTDMSAMSQGSFAWDKVLQEDDSLNKSVAGRTKSAEPNIQEGDFEIVNRMSQSFCQGQMSARSTSIGGSEDDKNAKTRDERFSDYTNPGKLFDSFSQNTYVPSEKFDDMIEQFPTDFMSMHQGQLGDEEVFESNDAVNLMDAAEKEFNQEHQFDLPEKPCVSYHDVSSAFSSTNVTPDNPSSNAVENQSDFDILSRSGFFRMNTSRLGSLTYCEEEERPHLGFSKLESPRKSHKLLEKVDSTYTVGSSSSENEKSDILDHDDKSNEEQSETLNASSISALLPSFLESSLNSTRDNSVLESYSKLSSSVSPTLPKITLTREIVEAKKKNPHNSLLKSMRVQRFSSPIKERPRKENVPKENNPISKRDAKKNLDLSACGQRNPLQEKNYIVDDPVGRQQQQPVPKPGHFPLQADKSKLTWLSVGPGDCEKQTLMLRNVQSEAVEVSLIIRESSCFKLGFAANQRLTIDGYSTKQIPVSFQPYNDKLVRGRLVIKVIGSSARTGKALKATILLQGQGGCPSFQISGTGDFLNERRTLSFGKVADSSELSCKWIIKNEGSGHGFFKLQGFLDPECRMADNESHVIIRPSCGVLAPNESICVKLRLIVQAGRQGLFLASVALFHGSELCRQVMLKARQLPGAPRLSASPALLCVDFSGNFSDVSMEQFQGVVDTGDVNHFYEKTKKEIIDLVGEQEQAQEAFKTLLAEETLSETRMNCTVLGESRFLSPRDETIFEEKEDKVVDENRLFPKDQHEEPRKTPVGGTVSSMAARSPVNPRGSPHTTGSKIPRPLPHSPAIARMEKTKKTKTVYLDCDNVMMPITHLKVRSHSKIKVKNRTDIVQKIRVGKLSAPFSTRQDTFLVQPSSYLCIPVFYLPLTHGPHEAMVTLFCENVPDLTARVRGNTIR